MKYLLVKEYHVPRETRVSLNKKKKRENANTTWRNAIQMHIKTKESFVAQLIFSRVSKKNVKVLNFSSPDYQMIKKKYFLIKKNHVYFLKNQI